MITQPDMRPIAGGKYRLAQPFNTRWRHHVFKIPAGTITDGASVPRLFWTISGLRPDGLIRAAALIHDVLYRHRGAVDAEYLSPWRRFSRAEADLVFLELMRAAGMAGWRARLAWRAVRVGGSWT